VESKNLVLSKLTEKQQANMQKQYNTERAKHNKSETTRRSEYYADMGGYNIPDPADMGDYERNLSPLVIDMPELVEIAHGLLGKFPKILQKLAGSKTLGRFNPKKGKIELQPAIFADPKLAIRVLAHEIGHVIDWVAEYGSTIARGNILGRIASFVNYGKRTLPEYPGAPSDVITNEDRERIRQEVQRLIDEEKATQPDDSTTDTSITPEDILAIWNDLSGRTNNAALYDYIARLSTAEKKSIIKMAMNGEVPPAVKNLIKKNVPYFDWDQKFRDMFQEKVQEEISKRFLYDEKVITQELKTLTQNWKPFSEAEQGPTYTDYRYSSIELYADAMSVLFNAPSLLQQTAPNFYKGFFAYLESKPQFKEMWDELQIRLADPTLKFKNRFDRLIESFERGEVLKREIATRKDKNQMSFGMILKLGFYTKAAQNRKLRNTLSTPIDAAHDPVYLAEQVLYSDGPIHLEDLAIRHKVYGPLYDAGIDTKTFGAYMLMVRFARERVEQALPEIAQPGGYTQEDAWNFIENLKRMLGDEKFDIVVKAGEEFVKARQPLLRILKKADMYAPNTMAMILDNDVYVKIEIQEYLDNFNKTNAKGSTIFHRYGSLADTTEPIQATFATDTYLAYAATRNMAIQGLEVYKDQFPDSVMEAEYRGNIPIQPKDRSLSLLTYLDKGKVRGLWVDRNIAIMFENDPYGSYELVRRLGKIASYISYPLKSLLITYNWAWAIWNVQRDIRAMAKSVRHAGLLKSIHYTIMKGLPRAWQEVVNGLPDDVVTEMYEKFELIPERYYSGKTETVEEKLQRGMMDIGKYPEELRKNLSTMGKIWKGIQKTIKIAGIPGALSEKMVKIGGHMMLADMMKTVSTMVDGETVLTTEPRYDEKELAHIVRTRIGSPNFRDAGLLSDIYNNVILFSNAGIRGMDASYEALRGGSSGRWDKVGTFIYLAKTFSYDIMPKIFMYAVGAGLLKEFLPEEFAKYLQRLVAGIPDKDKQNFTCIPLGFDANNKTIYIRLPSDFMGQLLGGIMWRSVNFKGPKDITSLLDFTMGNIPYTGFNPIIGSGYDISQYMTDKNVYDSWTGRDVFTEQEKVAGMKYTLPKFLKHEWNKLGGGMLYRFPTSERPHTLSYLEKLTKVPFAGPIMGRVVSISNRGHMDSIRVMLNDKGIAKTRASENIEAERAIADALSRYDSPNPMEIYKSLAEDKKIRPGVHPTWSDFQEKFKTMLLMRDDNQFLTAYLNPKLSKEEQMELMIYYLDKKTKGEIPTSKK
jgi:hypothetical protein